MEICTVANCSDHGSFLSIIGSAAADLLYPRLISDNIKVSLIVFYVLNRAAHTRLHPLPVISLFILDLDYLWDTSASTDFPFMKP